MNFLFMANGIEDGKTTRLPFPFPSRIPLMTPSLMFQSKLDCRSRKQKRKNKPITMLVLTLSECFLRQFSFILDHKRRSHKRNRNSAYDSVGLTFTISLRSALLITTPTPILSQVITNLTVGGG